jgi:hypothetical protein
MSETCRAARAFSNDLPERERACERRSSRRLNGGSLAMESMMWTYSSDGRLLMTAGERRPELQVLSSDDCYRLLATQQIGRLGVNAEHYPLILPVNYALDRAGVIVIRTDAGTKLAAANHANVTFEVDEIDQRTRSGWSVLVRALAEEVTSKHRTELIERTKAVGTG